MGFANENGAVSSSVGAVGGGWGVEKRL